MCRLIDCELIYKAARVDGQVPMLFYLSLIYVSGKMKWTDRLLDFMILNVAEKLIVES